MIRKSFLAVSVLLELATCLALASPCEDIHPNYRNGGGTMFGPYDYNAELPRKGLTGSPLQIVEQEHLTERVRTLKGGNTSSTPGGDLSYTLWAFPNHPQALLALIDYSIKENSDQPPQMRHTTPCYFKRAVQWRPDDARTRLIFGMYLYRNKKFASAIEQFSEALRLDPNSGNAAYNLGLAYFENKDYEKALEAAQTASTRGFRLDGLKNKLMRAGKWKDAPVPAPSMQASAPARADSGAEE